MAGEENKTQYVPALTSVWEAIGCIATGWAQLEHQINHAIWWLANVSQEDGACITAQIGSFLPRMRALIALAHRWGCSETTIKDLNKFASEADGVGRRRNRIIHDQWLQKDDDFTKFGRWEITADKRLVWEVKPQTREDILAVAHAISESINAFKKLRAQMADEISAAIRAQLVELQNTLPAKGPGLKDQDNAPEQP